MANQPGDEAIFREVDEEVRREQIQKLWDRYGTYVLAACIGVVLVVGGIKGWQYWQLEQAKAAGAQYVAALDLAEQGKMDEAGAAFARIVEAGGGGYVALARLQAAANLAAKGDVAEAVKAFDAVVADPSVERALRDLAQVRAALLLVDSASLADLKGRLADIDKEGHPWRNEAREILALAAYRAGELATAEQWMNEILADPLAGVGTRQRAQMMLALLSPERKPAGVAKTQ
jgi:hypothetical protein